MSYEIDQSGKIEQTSNNTVVAISNGVQYAVVIKASEKRKLKKYFRQKGIRSRYPYYVFSYCLAEIILYTKLYSRVVIDIEYEGHNETIKNEVAQILIHKGVATLHRLNLQFGYVGKKSNSHKLAMSVGRGRVAPSKVVTYSDVQKACGIIKRMGDPFVGPTVA